MTSNERKSVSKEIFTKFKMFFFSRARFTLSFHGEYFVLKFTPTTFVNILFFFIVKIAPIQNNGSVRVQVNYSEVSKNSNWVSTLICE